MIGHDIYIENYFFRLFNIPKSARLPRNVELEQKLVLICQVEYWLQTNVTAGELHCFDDKEGALKDRRYLIQFDMHGQYSFVNYVLNDTSDPKKPDHSVTKFIKACKTLLDIMEDSTVSIARENASLIGKLPLLNLYCQINKCKHIVAAKNLASALSIKPAVPQSTNFRIPPGLFPYGDAYFYGDDKMAKAFVLLIEHDDSKILLPGFIRSTLVAYNVAPVSLVSSLFQQSLLTTRPDAIVILTDSMELAKRNQDVLDKKGISDIIWLSWFGDRNAVPQIDWSPLKGRMVYYSLLPHSGFGHEEIYATAQRAKDATLAVGVKGFKYISWEIDNVPAVYKIDEYEAWSASASSSGYDAVAAVNPRDLDPRRMVMYPLIKESSLTLITGPKRSGKTFFAVHLALAMAYGRTIFKDWVPRYDPAILYLHGETGNHDSLGEKKEVLTQAVPPVSGSNEFNIQFKVAPDPLDTGLTAMVDFTRNQLAQYERKKADQPRVAVFDNLFKPTKTAMVVLDDLLNELRRDDWTVLLVMREARGSNSKSKKKDIDPLMSKHKPVDSNVAARLSVDNVIAINKSDSANGVLAMDISLKSSLTGVPNKMRCHLDFNSTPPTFVRHKKPFSRKHYTKEERAELVREFQGMRHNTSHETIVKKLKITKSMFKALDRECGYSKTRTKTQKRVIGNAK
jgi:AAA domain